MEEIIAGEIMRRKRARKKEAMKIAGFIYPALRFLEIALVTSGDLAMTWRAGNVMAIFTIENFLGKSQAEGGGFEPPMTLRSYLLSKQAH